MKWTRLSTTDWIALACFAVMAVGAYVRLFVSVGLVGFMDEQYWVTAATLSSLGGVPYFNDMHIQQTSSLLYEPLVYLYYKIFGTSAVILFVRHLYFLLSVTVAAVYFRFFRPRSDLPTALSISGLILVGTWWAQPALGYNSIGGLCFGCGALLAVFGVDRRNWRWLAWSGVLFFFSVGAYPTLVGGVAALWIFIAILRSIQRQPWLREMIVANVITIVLLAAFVGSLIWRTSWDDLILVYQFTTAHASLGSFTVKLGYGIWLWWKFLPPWWILLALFALWLVLWRIYDLSWSFYAVTVALMTAFHEPPEPGTYHPPLLMLLVISGVPLLIRAVKDDFRQNWTYLSLWLGGLAGTVFTCWSSALTIYTTFVTSTYCVAVLFVLDSRSKRFKPWASLLPLVISLIVFVHKDVLHQRDDESVTDEVEMMTSGPYAGLFTSPERARYFRELQNDIDEVKKNAKSILFYDEFPMGYLMADLFPATRSLWMHALREDYNVKGFYRAWYQNPENRPDVIFRFNFYPMDGRRFDVRPEQYKPYEDVFWDYLPREPEYVEVLRRDSYSAFKKKNIP